MYLSIISVLPLYVHIDSAKDPLSAERVYDIHCITFGSRPSALVTWWIGTSQLLDHSSQVCSSYVTYSNSIKLGITKEQLNSYLGNYGRSFDRHFLTRPNNSMLCNFNGTFDDHLVAHKSKYSVTNFSILFLLPYLSKKWMSSMKIIPEIWKYPVGVQYIIYYLCKEA